MTDASKDEELLFRAYLGIVVLKTVLTKISPVHGGDVPRELLAEMEAAHPEFPGRASLRIKLGMKR